MRADVYFNTGFDTINVPYAPSMLDSLSHVTYTDLDIMQTYPQSSIRVPLSPLTLVQLESLDYVKLSATGQMTVYYSVPVGGVQLTSPDVAVITLVVDYITTIGGVPGLTILAGMTNRRTVPKSQDTFGAFTEDDPYMGCNQPLQIVSGGWLNVGKSCSKIFVESTVALPRMATEKNGITFTDSDGNAVTIPTTEHIAGTTTYGLAGESLDAPSRGTRMYGYNAGATGTSVQNGMDVVRSIGAESAIISQYTVPDDMYKAEYPTGETGQQDYTYSKITGTSQEIDTGLAFNWNPQVLNNRILYGSNCDYHIVTAAGNEASFRPEDISESGSSSPHVVVKSDPRPDGRPYFRFKRFLSDTGSFWTNAVQGEGWRHVPLVYTQTSGNVLDLYHFDAEREAQQTSYDYGVQSRRLNYARQGVDRVTSTISSATQGAIAGASAGPLGALISGITTGGAAAASNLLGHEFDRQSFENQNEYEHHMYDLQRRKAEADLGIQTMTKAPTVAIPPSAGCIRDFVGNSCFVYRTRPTPTDVARLDKILGLYGYKSTKVLEKSDLDTRSKFTYIEANGVQVGGTAPRWLREGCNMALNGGVRIWKVQPSQDAYLSNS